MQASAEQQVGAARPTKRALERVYTFADLSAYAAKERFLIQAMDLAFFMFIKLIGRTVKFEIAGWENWEAASREGALILLRPSIFPRMRTKKPRLPNVMSCSERLTTLIVTVRNGEFRQFGAKVRSQWSS